MWGCQNKVDDSRVARVSTAEVARRLEKGANVGVLDARDAEAFARGHIPGARRIELPEVDPHEPTPSLEGYSSLIVYGQNPGSGTAIALAKRLMQAKHKNVLLMESGFDRWQTEGRPVAGE